MCSKACGEHYGLTNFGRLMLENEELNMKTEMH
jgi:hypothetical protein